MGVCNQLETSTGLAVLRGRAHGNPCCLAAQQLRLVPYGAFLEHVALLLDFMCCGMQSQRLQMCGLARLCLHLVGQSRFYPARSRLLLFP